jgi:hypothetical protein
MNRLLFSWPEFAHATLCVAEVVGLLALMCYAMGIWGVGLFALWFAVRTITVAQLRAHRAECDMNAALTRDARRRSVNLTWEGMTRG